MSQPVTMLFIGGVINGKAHTVQSPPQPEYRIPHQRPKVWQMPRHWRPGQQQVDCYILGTDLLGNPAYQFDRTEHA